MPFIKKNDRGQQAIQSSSSDARRIFVGRQNELAFFVEHILKPEDPDYNIVSIYGDGGVGKSTLFARFIEETHAPEYKDYCLIASVDERQATPASMMEKFAEELHIQGTFRKALVHYKEAQRRSQEEPDSPQDEVVQRTTDFAGAFAEMVPVVGPVLRETVKASTSHIMNTYLGGQAHHELKRLDETTKELTRTFVNELNHIADALVAPGGSRATHLTRRRHRILLFFDTFEQLAAEAVPWLLDYFLTLEISSNVVLLTAGRFALDRSLPDDPKRWLQFKEEGNVIYTISLRHFTEQETQAYLEHRGITAPEHVKAIWQLSHGLPLFLGLLTADAGHAVDPTADVVNNFLRWIPEKEEIRRRLVLDAALFSRPFNQDDLEAFAYISDAERAALYRWLLKQPFVRRHPQDGRYSYHELARDLFSRHLYQSSPNTCYATRRALVDYYRAELARLQAQGDVTGSQLPLWLSLTLALAQQCFLLPDSASHCTAIEQILYAYERTKQDGDIERVLRDLVRDEAYNQANPDACQAVTLLLNYLEALEPAATDQQALLTITDYWQAKELEHQEAQNKLDAINALLTRLRQATAFSPTLLASIYEDRGIAQRKLKHFQASIADFNQAITLDAHYASAYGNRATTHRYLNQDEQAIADCDEALALDDTLAWVYASRGEACRHLNRFQEASIDFTRALALDPHYIKALVRRARTSIQLGKRDQAFKDISYALALETDSAAIYHIHMQFAQTCVGCKYYALAIEHLSEALKVNPVAFRAYGSRGAAYANLREYAQAIADFDQGIRLNPAYGWAYGQRGKVYRHLQNYERALADLNMALELDPNDAWAYRQRGLVHTALQRHDLALTDLERSIALDPKRGQSYSYRGGVYLALMQLPEAAASYRRSHELVVSDINAAWMDLWLDMCQQDVDDTLLRRLEEVADLNQKHYISVVCMCIAEWLRGEAATALTSIARVGREMPQCWDPPFWQGLIEGASGQQRCLKTLEHALDLGLPALLLLPLRWIERSQPELYASLLRPLLQRQQIIP